MARLSHFVQIRPRKGRPSYSRLRQFFKTGVPKVIRISSLLNEHIHSAWAWRSTTSAFNAGTSAPSKSAHRILQDSSKGTLHSRACAPETQHRPESCMASEGYNQQSRFSLCKPRSWAFGKLAGTTYRLNFARKESPKVTVRNKEPEGATGLEPTTSSVTEVLTNGNTPPDCFDNERNSLCLGNAGRSQLRLQETSVQ